ncbi:MAG: GNAT family N-acetyltransferase [Elainella sp. Prado103]|jgi:GNAT superfamily N-acetyltransferase|nr:GNAT family N-acetyltransferase [Elainella sp. Prado103]
MTQSSLEPPETIDYSPMDLARHRPKDVACLIDESAPELFALMFGSHSVPCLTELIKRSHNRFSHQYIQIAESNHQVVGIATLVPAEMLNHNPDYQTVLNLGQKVWLNLVQRLLLRYLLQEVYPAGAFYIGNLAVAPEYRNQGIGRQLLLHCIATATALSDAPDPIFISVDVKNGRAQKLYESLGFRVVATKTIQVLGWSIGSRILSLSI